MRIRILSIFFLCMAFGTATANEKTDQQVIGQVLDLHGVVNGAWFINQRCDYLEKSDRQEFEFYRDQLNEFVLASFPSNVTGMIRRMAEKVASQGEYSTCNEKTSRIVVDGIDRLKEILTVLPGYVEFSNTEFSGYLELRAKRLIDMHIVEKKCKNLPDNVRSMVESNLTYSLDLSKQYLTTDRLRALYFEAKEESKMRQEWNCGDPSVKLLANRMPDLRDFVATREKDKIKSE